MNIIKFISENIHVISAVLFIIASLTIFILMFVPAIPDNYDCNIQQNCLDKDEIYCQNKNNNEKKCIAKENIIGWYGWIISLILFAIALRILIRRRV